MSARTATALRKAGIATELYLSEDKLKKQFKYANARRFPWVIVIGPSEAENGTSPSSQQRRTDLRELGKPPTSRQSFGVTSVPGGSSPFAPLPTSSARSPTTISTHGPLLGRSHPTT